MLRQISWFCNETARKVEGFEEPLGACRPETGPAEGSGPCCTMSKCPSYHGFVGISTSLELQNSIGVCWVALGVFADSPLLRLGLRLFVLLSIFAGCCTWQRGNMLVDELATATPGNKGKVVFSSPPLAQINSSQQVNWAQ